MDIEQLRERLLALNNAAQDIRTRAEAEKRDLTTEEAAELDRILDEADRRSEDITRLERLADQTAALAQPTGRKTKPSQPTEDGAESLAKVPAVPRDYTVTKTGGFSTLGEMAYHIANHCRGGRTDPRLERLAAATTYGNESSGSDGGYAVPVDFRAAIMQTILGEDSLLSRCDQVNCSGNTFTQPVDETTPWQTSGGIQAYWDGEAVAATQSKPTLGERTIKLNKLRALVPMTDELLEDASAMDSYLRRKAPEKIAFKVNDALVNGTGVGMPLGLLASASLVSVAKETSQTAATLVGNNIIKMYSRMYGPSRSKAVWLVNQDIEPMLYKLSVPGTDNVGNAVTGWGTLVYMPPGGLSGAPYGTLFGRPVIPTQACQTLGTKGDIILADFSQYLALLKSGPNPKVDVSIHLWFDQDLTAFKFTLRMGGLPWWSTAMAAKNGSTTYSTHVSLDTRA
jgi:HK97 family phage major capsid protein